MAELIEIVSQPLPQGKQKAKFNIVTDSIDRYMVFSGKGAYFQYLLFLKKNLDVESTPHSIIPLERQLSIVCPFPYHEQEIK